MRFQIFKIPKCYETQSASSSAALFYCYSSDYFLRKDQLFRLRLAFSFKEKGLRHSEWYGPPQSTHLYTIFFLWRKLNLVSASINQSYWTVLFYLSGRPGFFDPKGKAKWDAWKAVEGLLRLVPNVQSLPDRIPNWRLHTSCHFCLNREVQGGSDDWLHHQGEAAAGGGCCCIHFLGHENTTIHSAACINK